MRIGAFFAKDFFRYKHLFFQLVSRDIKLRYRRSLLGYFWSVLNPLMIMVIMTIVFSTMFVSGIKNFPVYLLVGQLLFSFMMSSTTHAMGSVIANAALLKKISVPKYIFTLAAVSSEFVTMIFSLGALVIVMLVTDIRFSWYLILIVIPIIELYVFCIGLGLFLAQATVFFRDIQYIWTVLCTAWMYLTPIFYPIELLPGWLRNVITNFNPLYYYIAIFRDFALNENPVWIYNAAYGAVAALLMLFIGLLTFSRTKNKFILYI
jgi:lipopolysaccharide transport system permease protein